LCPGNTPNATAGSGAPKKTAGIVSKKECVIDIAIMNIANEIGDVKPRK